MSVIVGWEMNLGNGPVPQGDGCYSALGGGRGGSVTGLGADWGLR